MRRAATTTPDLQALYMATLTLTRMAEGGLYDQLGGGFCRYSVDQYWMIPHFEKMLYDNGALLAVTRRPRSPPAMRCSGASRRKPATGCCARCRTPPKAASTRASTRIRKATKASSTSGSREEVRAALTPERMARVRAAASASTAAELRRRVAPARCSSLEQIAEGNRSSSRPRCERRSIRRARKLLAIRSQRVWPGRDDKILTSWNALAIRGLGHRGARARAGRSSARPPSARSISCAPTLWRDGRLLATSKDGVAHLNAYLDDYAYLADALLEMLQLRWRNEDAAWLRELLDAMLAHFEDPKLGGFFFTSDDHEALIHRSKSFSDDAIPAGNGIAARVLIRAGYLLGETRYLEAAERTLRAAWLALNRFPHGHVSLLEALDGVPRHRRRS